MKSAERAALAALAPVILHIATVAWAGARASSRGSMLYRDGAVARVALTEQQAMVQVVDGEQVERVVLKVHAGDLQADCSCNQAPCAHAVAALMELQKRARIARDAEQQQSTVMAALRQRLGGAREEPDKVRALSNLERLPLDAGVDMVALALRQSLRHGPGEMRELTLVVDRLLVHGTQHPQQARELALRLLQALNARKVVFVPLPEAAEHAGIRLVPLVTGVAGEGPPSPEVLRQLIDLALNGHAQVAVHIAAGLDVTAMRDAEFCATLAPLLLERVGSGDVAWREVSAPTGRDRLASAVVSASLHHGKLPDALAVALAWPPMRGALQQLAEKLGSQGRYEDIVRLVGHYDPRGDQWTAGVQAAAEAALRAGHAPVAAKLTAWAFERQPQAIWYDLLARIVPAAQWPERRDQLIARLLADDDPVWLADRLAAEADAAHALLHAVLIAPLRERTARDALVLLRRIDPLAAFHGRCARLLALVRVPGQTARVLKDEFTQVEALSAQLGEPALVRDLARLLGRELADHAALTTAITAAVGLLSS